MVGLDLLIRRRLPQISQFIAIRLSLTIGLNFGPVLPFHLLNLIKLDKIATQLFAEIGVIAVVVVTWLPPVKLQDIAGLLFLSLLREQLSVAAFL